MYVYVIEIAYFLHGVSKKLSFTELSIRRFAMNIISISSQLAAGSPNAQFDKIPFFETPCMFLKDFCLMLPDTG